MNERNFKVVQDTSKGMKEKVDELYANFKNQKPKKLKIPRKAKVKRGRLRKGWIGILKIDENGNLTGEKQRIFGSCLTTGNRGNLYHATDGREILFWNGKFPVIIQPTWKKNPMLIRNADGKEGNETYGDPYIKARMLADVIKIKGKGMGMGIVWIIGIGIAGYVAYMLFTGGF